MKEIFENEKEFLEAMKGENPRRVFFSIKYASAEAKDIRAGVTVVGTRLTATMAFAFIQGASAGCFETEIASEFIANEADIKAFQDKSDELCKAKLETVKAFATAADFYAGEVE